jgi:hypothetical protein
MKIRQGFVSNSSSSSFYIGGDIETEVQITFPVDMNNFVDKSIFTKEELDKHFEYWYGSNWREVENEYLQLLELINDGKVVHYCRVGNDYDSFDSDYLYQKIEYGTIFKDVDEMQRSIGVFGNDPNEIVEQLLALGTEKLIKVQSVLKEKLAGKIE